MSCVIKYEYINGEKLPRHKQELWCGKFRGVEWCFVDAQHAALADKVICNECSSNIIKSLKDK